MRTVDGRYHLRVALLQVRAAVRLVEHTHLTSDPAQLVGPSAIRSQPLSAQQVHRRRDRRTKYRGQGRRFERRGSERMFRVNTRNERTFGYKNQTILVIIINYLTSVVKFEFTVVTRDMNTADASAVGVRQSLSEFIIIHLNTAVNNNNNKSGRQHVVCQ